MQSASHNFPKLMGLFWNPGMMKPVRAALVGMVGMASWAVAQDVLVSPVAVRMVVRGVEGLRCVSGAVPVK